MHHVRSVFSKASLLSFATVSLLGLSAFAFFPRDAQAKRPTLCSPDLKHRTPQEVIEEHVALLQAGDLDRAMCDYADNATVILPGVITTGVANIRQALSGFMTLFGNARPVVDTITSSGPVVLLTFSVTGPVFSIPNGSDTYIVQKGKIQYQTVHDVIVPTAP